jgi:hypothetical protein
LITICACHAPSLIPWGARAVTGSSYLPLQRSAQDAALGHPCRAARRQRRGVASKPRSSPWNLQKASWALDVGWNRWARPRETLFPFWIEKNTQQTSSFFYFLRKFFFPACAISNYKLSLPLGRVWINPLWFIPKSK